MSYVKAKDPEKGKELERQLSQLAACQQGGEGETSPQNPAVKEQPKTDENKAKLLTENRLIGREEVFTGKVKYRWTNYKYKYFPIKR